MNPTDSQIKAAKQITSVFENDTPILQYDYAEKLDDFKLRGVTFGLGFCTRMDGIDVLEELEKIHPIDYLLEYKPLMKKAINSSFYNRFRFPTKQFIVDWGTHGSFDDTIKAQDIVYKRNSIDPAIRICEKYGLKNFWSFVNVFDTVVMQGEEGCEEIFTSFRNNKATENLFMAYFAHARIKYMIDSKDDEWKKAINRPSILQTLTDEHWDQEEGPYDLDFGDYGKFTI